MGKRCMFVLLMCVLLSGTAFAVEFSADTVTTIKGGQKVEGKMYFKPDKFRMEMKMNEGMIMITRIDKEVMWNIITNQKMYMEMPLDMKHKPKVEEKYPGEIERKEVGRETVDGHPATKYLITYQVENKKSQVFQWLATDINFPVKTAAFDGSWTQEFKDVKMESQPDSLFEIPPGYEKMQMPQMPGGMNFRNMR